MSPSPTGATAAPRLRTQRAPLRVTLVALVVALVAVALLATGLASTSLLRDYQTEQQDAKLRTLAGELERNPTETGTLCGMSTVSFPGGGYLACIPAAGPARLFKPGPSSVTALPDVSDITTSTVGRFDDGAFTRRGADGSTAWRLTATRLPTGLVIVVGIDLSDYRRVLGRLVGLQIAVGLIVLAALGVAGTLVVRTSLRPLVDVERTAQAIAAGDLSRRVPIGDDHTEVGRLATALNGMLGRIESSFRAQQVSEEQARASEARMRRFVADASHELRTPLTSIRGFAELHRHGAVSSPEDAGRMMHRIESEAIRMGMLVEDLLQLARMDQQRELTILPVDLAELADDAVTDARAVQPSRPLEVHLDSSLTEDPVVLGDEARLRQVIGNLVTNALTHTPPDTRVEVRLSEPADDPDTVVVAVRDEGPGMAPADADRVFERFYRADTSRTRTAGGSGLGLSIVASLVAAHGGTVAVETAPGQGATFLVRLPRSGPG